MCRQGRRGGGRGLSTFSESAEKNGTVPFDAPLNVPRRLNVAVRCGRHTEYACYDSGRNSIVSPAANSRSPGGKTAKAFADASVRRSAEPDQRSGEIVAEPL